MEFVKDVNSTIIFTDFSRFNSIRAMLLDKNMIKQIIEKDILDNKINCCEYVEFTANMATTSLLSWINTLIGVIESYDIKILDNLIRKKLSGIATSDYYNRFLKSLAPYLSILNSNGILVPDKFIIKVNGPGLNVIPVAIYV